MKLRWLIPLVVLLSPLSHVMQGQVSARVATVVISPNEVTVLHLRPEFESSIRMPEEVTSVILGSPGTFKAEHNEGEPEYVYVKPVTKEPAQSNLLVATKSGAHVTLELISDGNAASTGQPVDFLLEYRTGGDSVRIVLSNGFGTILQRLRIGGATIALTDGNGNINPSDAVNLTFAGKAKVVLAPQSQVVSDPVQLHLRPDSDVAISIYVPGQKIDTITYHKLAQQMNFVAVGNDINMASLPNPTPVTEWYILKGLEVHKEDIASAIVCLGDSITDGFRSTIGANNRWPNILFDRLQKDGNQRKLSVLDLGIGGNRVLESNVGPNALARFDRDVLGQSTPRYLVLLEGINDIGLSYRTTDPLPYPPTAADLIAGYEQIITRAHAHNITVYGGTLLPYKGAPYYSDAGEEVRQTVNDWIRSSGAFDRVIDFDAVMRDPERPLYLNPTYSSIDHLHPNDQGYRVMGESIPLGLFNYLHQ